MFVPVTAKRIVDATSPTASRYVVAVAPPMAPHDAPLVLHRCHWCASAGVGDPVQVPAAPVSVWPCSTVPEIYGAMVFAGATEPLVFATVPVAVVVEVAELAKVAFTANVCEPFVNVVVSRKLLSPL